MANSARENILKKIKQALGKPVPVPFPGNTDKSSVYQPNRQELELEFAENFVKLQGRFSFCANEAELAAQLQELTRTRNWQSLYCRETDLKTQLATAGYLTEATDLNTCDAAITGCEYLVARTGSIMMSSRQQSGRTVSVYAPVHICIAYTDQLVYDIADGFAGFDNGTKLPSMITLASGPSRTADIEKTLVVGVHGPKEVFCFLVER